jgi:hypothetical protein
MAIAAIWFIGAVMVNAAATDASKALDQVIAQSKARDQAAALAEQQRQQAAATQAQLQDQEQQTAIEAAAQARQLELEKQQAWSAYYTAPKSCDTPKDWAAQVQCGNLYIRAKREFEAHWAAMH